jgi:hypothetical protein
MFGRLFFVRALARRPARTCADAIVSVTAPVQFDAHSNKLLPPNYDAVVIVERCLS